MCKKNLGPGRFGGMTGFCENTKKSDTPTNLPGPKFKLIQPTKGKNNTNTPKKR